MARSDIFGPQNERLCDCYKELAVVATALEEQKGLAVIGVQP